MAAKTSTGFEAEIIDGFSDDWEYVEGITDLLEGRSTGYVKIARCIMPQDDLERLKKHCTEEGHVSVTKMSSEILELIKASRKNS